MRDETIAALERINRSFYDASARAFSRTREAPWPGWSRVFEIVAGVHGRGRDAGDPRTGLSVLDVGAGNGRLLRALLDAPTLTEHRPIAYTGVDACAALLDDARARSTPIAGALASVSLVEADVLAPHALEALPRAGLVAAMGLFHHVPSRARRLALFDALAGRLAAPGVLAISLWRFGAQARFASKSVPWSAHPEIDVADLEPGDVLLSFEGRGARYCHAIDASEEDALVARGAALGLTLADVFTSDGRTRDLNRHVVFTV
ncbi:class I SAM-dependent methyltransferase [Myxococcota bacterium]|nr:class I SAM-dependent methyltransferase [Myxococcota bacterium]